MANNVISALPYNLEAEQSILGSILIDKELQYEIRAELRREDFYMESHKLVFDSICSVLDANKPVDLVTLTDDMAKTKIKNKKKRLRGNVDLVSLAEDMESKTTLEKAGGIEYLSALSLATPSAANYEYYLKIVKRDSTLRKLIRSAEEIIKDAKLSTDSAKSLALAESKIYEISEQLDTSSLTNIKINVDEVIEMFNLIQKDKNYNQGLKTGFTVYDKMTKGLHKGNLVIVAARPSVGKTTLVMNIVEHVAIKSNAVCAVFALEMTKNELAERMIYSLSGVPSEVQKEGKLETKDWQKIWNAEKLIQNAEINIDDSSIVTVPDILSKCRRLKSLKGRLDLIVVDHIQLMTAVKSNDSRQAEITEISRGLKMIAKELDVPVIALSQLNRDGEKKGTKPVLSNLRESGAIEQDADVVMFIHRPDRTPEGAENPDSVKKDETEIIIAKNRSGPIGSFNLMFKGELSKFVNITYNENNLVIPPENPTYNSFTNMSDVVYDDNFAPPEDDYFVPPVDEIYDGE
ncbi:MAG: replicative DNA helicase [Clostridia bacterium]|nr:replicative DNA helicase [Clostridia bacterium]